MSFLSNEDGGVFLNSPVQSTVKCDVDYGLVSIIMPNYNGEKYLNETIESVLSQTYPNWELLFVDDCSTDSSLEIVESYNDIRIKVFQNEVNSGAAVSRNWALREATGKWIAFLDSDDVWYPNKLERQLAFMVDNGYCFSYTAYERMDEDSNSLNMRITGPKKINKRKMFRYDYIGCLTVMYDAEKIGVVQVEPSLKCRNDYAIWLKVCRLADCYYLDEVMARYRIREKSLSRIGLKRLIKNQYRLYRYGEKMGVLRSGYHVGLNIFFGFWKKVIFTKR